MSAVAVVLVVWLVGLPLLWVAFAEFALWRSRRRWARRRAARGGVLFR